MFRALIHILTPAVLAFSAAGCEKPQADTAPKVPANDIAAAVPQAALPPPTSNVSERLAAPETPDADKSAVGARRLLVQYGELLEQGRYEEARKLWSSGGEASGKAEKEFAASFDGYREIHAEAGMPGQMEGAAGSIFIDIPFRLYGLTEAGEPFNEAGTITLRRVNDVPGSTGEQRRWHIFRWEVKPAS